MHGRHRKWLGSALPPLSAAFLLLSRSVAGAQAVDQFGERSRANAAREMIVLAVQQGISSLPPTSGQSFTYEFNLDLGTWEPSAWMGPTALRSPEPVGKGKLSLRLAGSYFHLTDSFGPMLYAGYTNDGTLFGYTQFGLDASAQVGLVNVGATYGVLDRLDLIINIPVVITNVSASQSFLVCVGDANGKCSPNDPQSGTGGLNTPLSQVDVAGVPPVANPQRAINAALQCNQPDCLRTRTATIGELSGAFRSNGFPGIDFNEGTNAGVGRISIGGKYVLYAGGRYKLALMTEFFAPSPDAAQFAGSDSASILPRFVAAASVTDSLRLHADVGYDADFSFNELRRFTWDVGASWAFARATLDCGFGGSKFNEGITWTPNTAPYGDRQGNQIGTIVAQGDTMLGSNFVDFLGGMKFKLAEQWVLSGAVSVPINDQGFRAAAVGTGAIEYSF